MQLLPLIRRVPCNHYPWCIGPHCTAPLAVISSGQDWKPFQTCSLEDPPLPDADKWWLLKHVHVGKGEVHILLECFLVTTPKRSCGKVIFLHPCIILFMEGAFSVQGEGVSALGGFYPEVSVQGVCLVGSPSGGSLSRGGICPGGGSLSLRPPIWWKSGRYASYWNAFLCRNKIV